MQLKVFIENVKILIGEQKLKEYLGLAEVIG
jgi:hypothetical protein